MAGLLGVFFWLATSSSALALPVVQYSVSDLGGGLFQYNLTVDNDDGGEALSGLNILYADSVFGLDENAVIGAPAGWMSFAPLPPLVHDVNYFSLTAATDIPIDGALGGFSFRSTTDPDSIGGLDFTVEGIGSETASQIPLGVAVPVPEPSTALLLVLGLTELARGARSRRAWSRNAETSVLR
jgi:hypothetical protein